MDGLRNVFLTLLEMSVSAGLVILAILAIRAVCRKAPRKYLYVLWALAAVRLMIPWAPQTGISVFNLGIFQTADAGIREVVFSEDDGAGAADAETAAAAGSGAGADTGKNMTDKEGAAGMEPDKVEADRAETNPASGTVWLSPAAGVGTESGTGGSGAPETGETAADGTGPAAGDSGRSPGGKQDLFGILAVAWAAGAAAFLLYQFFCRQLLKRQTAQAVRREEGVWECDGIGSPFVMGVLRPRIYIPFRLAEEQRRFILLHERCHICRGDHIARFLATVLLAVYWFHPLVWSAFYCMETDMEMGCDEMVLERLGQNAREDYGRCLLAFAVPGRRIPAPAFGESAPNKRIRHILNFRKPRKGAAAGIALAGVLLAVFFLTNGKGQLPGLMFGGTLAYGGADQNSDHLSHGIEYRMDGRTKSAAFYREVWREGELADYELLSVRTVGEAEGELPSRGRIVSSRDYDFDPGNWRLDSRLFLEPAGGGEAEALSETYSVSGSSGGSFGDSFRVDENRKQDEIAAEDDLVIAAHHIGWTSRDGNSGGVSSFPCAELDDRRVGLYWNPDRREANSTEILYRMVVSGQTAEELEEACLVSPNVLELMDGRTAGAGSDTVPDSGAGIARASEAVYMKEMGEFTVDLNIDLKPETVTFLFSEEPDDAARWNLKMRKKAVLLLALIESAERIEWSYPEGNGEKEICFMMDVETAQEKTGIRDVKGAAGSAASLQELWEKAAVLEENNRHMDVEYTEDGRWRTEDGETYPYRYITSGILPNASYGGLAEIVADELDVTYDEAMLETVLSSTYTPGRRGVRIIGFP